MTEQSSLHEVLRKRTESLNQSFKENLIYHLDKQKEQEFFYSYAKKQCAFLPDKVCLYIKHSFKDQSPYFTLNYPKINNVVKKKKNSSLIHSQSINFDRISNASVCQQSILIIGISNLTQLVFIFQSGELAKQWQDLIEIKIKENLSYKRKHQDQIDLNSLDHTIKNLTYQIHRKDMDISRLQEQIISIQQRGAIIRSNLTTQSLGNTSRTINQQNQNNRETILEQENIPLTNDQINAIVKQLFQQILKKNHLIDQRKTEQDNRSSQIQLTRSNFITNKQDLAQNMVCKLSKKLRISVSKLYKILSPS